MHDTGNYNMIKSAAKCQGNFREFHGAGEWLQCRLFDSVDAVWVQWPQTYVNNRGYMHFFESDRA